jgi:hypothetical protein
MSVTKFNIATEARKVLKGKPTKVSRETLLMAFALQIVGKAK